MTRNSDGSPPAGGPRVGGSSVGAGLKPTATDHDPTPAGARGARIPVLTEVVSLGRDGDAGAAHPPAAHVDHTSDVDDAALEALSERVAHEVRSGMHEAGERLAARIVEEIRAELTAFLCQHRAPSPAADRAAGARSEDADLHEGAAGPDDAGATHGQDLRAPRHRAALVRALGATRLVRRRRQRRSPTASCYRRPMSRAACTWATPFRTP